MAYIREDENGSAMIIANRNVHEIYYNLPENFKNSTALYGENPENGNVFIPACSFSVLSK